MLHIYRQIRAMRSFAPFVFCQKRENTEDFPFDRVLVLPKPRTHPLRRLWQKQILGRPITIYRSEARRLLGELRKVDARLLHVYFGHIGVHLLPFLEISPLPVIVSFHGADAQVDLEKPSHRQPLQRVLQKADRLLVRSDSLAQRLLALGCDPAKIRLHRTGLPLAEIAFHQRTPPTDGAWRCVQACRLIAKKGLPTSLRAFAEFAASHPDATFTIAGEGPMLRELQDLVQSLGLAGRVHFPGFLSQAQLRQLLSEAHLFLHPSELGPNGDQEGVPNSMLEAMASGLPVVATRHGGIPEAVEHGVSGCLVAEGDAPALATEMLRLARNPLDFTRMSAAAADHARKRFDLDVQSCILEEIYRELLDEVSNSVK